MSKYAFLIHHKEYESFLIKLRNLGVLQIEEKPIKDEVNMLQKLSDKTNDIQDIIHRLKHYLDDEKEADKLCSNSIDPVEGDKVRDEAYNLLEDIEHIENQIRTKELEVADAEPWGDFDSKDICKLEEIGLHLVFMQMPNSLFIANVQSRPDVIEIAGLRGLAFFVVVTKNPDDVQIEGAERVKRPENGILHIRKEKQELEIKLKEKKKELSQKSGTFVSILHTYKLQIDDKYHFGKALLIGEKVADNKLIYLEGWVPSTEKSAMVRDLESEGYYTRQLEIQADDHVPIKLKNNSFSRLFEPITKLFSLPNYREIDQTVLLAPFFMLFFGLCFGDGGYGLLLFTVATFLRFKNRGKDTSILQLLQWLGGAAFVVGLLIGSFFGVTLPYAKPDNYFLNQDNLMVLSVVIGVVQIIFAKGIAAYKIKMQRGVKYSIAPFAWVIVLIGSAALYIALKIVPHIGEAVKYVIATIIILALLTAFFYNTPGKNPFLNFGVGLWSTYETASGLLGDSLSYIRLFAIGLTGTILGGVFNDLAITQTEGLNLFVRIPLAVFILLAGHSINIGLAMIGSFVHPLRLTFVEFYKNSQFEGGGKPYEPFKKSIN